MISKILVPTDGSDNSGKAVEYAVEFAKQTGALITFLSVIDSTAFLSQSIPGDASPTHIIEPVEDYLKQAARSYTEEAENLCRKEGIQSNSVIRSGHPVEEILDEAGKSKSDIIIIGSRGKSALVSAVLGSVTFGVIHKDTKHPVLVVR